MKKYIGSIQTDLGREHLYGEYDAIGSRWRVTNKTGDDLEVSAMRGTGYAGAVWAAIQSWGGGFKAEMIWDLRLGVAALHAIHSQRVSKTAAAGVGSADGLSDNQ